MLLKNIANLLPDFDFNRLTAIDKLLIEHFHAAVESLAKTADNGQKVVLPGTGRSGDEYDLTFAD